MVRRAQQRRGIIDGLIRQWQRYRDMAEKLRRWLLEMAPPASPLCPGTTVPLQQARALLDATLVRVCVSVCVLLVSLSVHAVT